MSRFFDTHFVLGCKKIAAHILYRVADLNGEKIDVDTHSLPIANFKVARDALASYLQSQLNYQEYREIGVDDQNKVLQAIATALFNAAATVDTPIYHSYRKSPKDDFHMLEKGIAYNRLELGNNKYEKKSIVLPEKLFTEKAELAKVLDNHMHTINSSISDAFENRVYTNCCGKILHR